MSSNEVTQNPSTSGATAPDLAGEDLAFHEGFQRVEAEVRAVPLDRLMPINFDVRAVVTTILGVYPELVELRPAIEELPVSVEFIYKVKDYALALGYAHSRMQVAVQTSDALAAVAQEGIVVRDQLQADAQGFAKRGIIRPEVLTRFRSGTGYRGIAFDLVGLPEVFLDVWDKLEGKTPLTREEVENARKLGARIAQLIGVREQGPVVRDQAAVLRQQAYVLCSESYEEARHAVAFVRRKEGDAESIAPSLFAGRGGRGSQPSAPPSDAPATPAPGANPVAPSASATSDVPVGHPGSPAFVRS
jgi:hypothetical protein